MKKQYIIPETLTVRLDSECLMLANTSNVTFGDEGSGTADLSGDGETDFALGRGLWSGTMNNEW